MSSISRLPISNRSFCLRMCSTNRLIQHVLLIAALYVTNINHSGVVAQTSSTVWLASRAVGQGETFSTGVFQEVTHDTPNSTPFVAPVDGIYSIDAAFSMYLGGLSKSYYLEFHAVKNGMCGQGTTILTRFYSGASGTSQ